MDPVWKTKRGKKKEDGFCQQMNTIGKATFAGAKQFGWRSESNRIETLKALRCFEVFFVPGKIHQSYDPVRFSGDFVFGLSTVCPHGILSRNGLSARSKSHEMGRRGGCPSALDFVSVFHDRRAAAAAAVVQERTDQGSNHGALSGIDVSHDGHPKISRRKCLTDGHVFLPTGVVVVVLRLCGRWRRLSVCFPRCCCFFIAKAVVRTLYR
jgi:hypothetical protein